MKNKIRHINIDGIIYKYTAKDWYVKIYPKKNSDYFVKIDFFTKDLEYQNILIHMGCFKTFENGEPKYLIIHQPGLVANVIKHFKINEFDFSLQKQYIITEAVKDFEAMKYHIEKTKILSVTNNNFIFKSLLRGSIAFSKTTYTWKLSRYVRPKENCDQFTGRVKTITDNLNNGITASIIINKLNEGNIFDFQYIPEEKDTLLISYKKDNRNMYLPLIFLNRSWKEGLYRNLEEYIAEGEIIIKEKENL